MRTHFYSVRKVGKYPAIYIELARRGNIKISIFPVKNMEGFSIYFPRLIMRKLAETILQALDEVK